MQVQILNPHADIHALGFIPAWLQMSLPEEPFVAIVKRHYMGGWHSFKQDELDLATGTWYFLGDPAQTPLAAIWRFKAKEVIYAYQYAFFAVVSLADYVTDYREAVPTGEWDLARLD